MIKFISDIEKAHYKKFLEHYPDSHLFQSYEWGELKSNSGWEVKTVGLEENGDLIAAALILLKFIPIVNKKVAYAPRGFLFGFENKDVVQLFTSHLKEYLSMQNVFMFRIDPDILYRERDIDGLAVEDGNDNLNTIQYLKQIGYVHRGKELNYGGFQPRFTFRLKLKDSKEEVFRKFHRQTQYKIRYAQRRGIEIFEGGREHLTLFDELSDITAERQQFTMRPLSYFEKMYEIFTPRDQFKLFFSKCNLKTSVAYVEDLIRTKDQEQLSTFKKIQKKPASTKVDKLQQNLQLISEQLSKLKEEVKYLKKLKSEHPDGIILSAAIFMKHGNKAWYLYGASHNVLRNYMANYLLQWHMIQEAHDAGCEIYDFYGMSGDLTPKNPLYGIYKFKRGFLPEFTEFVGEFDLVISPFHYYIFTKALPLRKWFRSKRLQVKEKITRYKIPVLWREAINRLIFITK
ncbi:lipid II:glycine glycyltransferase FemX [Pseudalkalibacillus sp. R45]|uniref:lipid II:glycine glycyltransferase FemX n=1 Tax=Pseudalkalibacillus sp. R45 TaxID=3457433 RepID=UPI003FCE78C1